MKRMNGRDVCRSSVKRSGNVLSRSVANWTRAMSCPSACNLPITEETVADFPVPRAPQSSTSCAAWPEDRRRVFRSEEHTSELQSLMRISYAVFCLKKKKHTYI